MCISKKSQKGVFWNKQTQFFVFLISKSFVLLWLFMGRKMRKIYFQKHGKNIIFCVSSKSSLFEVAILNLGLEGSNLRILRLGKAHMPRNIQNYWFLTKNNHVKKVYQKFVIHLVHWLLRSVWTFKAFLWLQKVSS